MEKLYVFKGYGPKNVLRNFRIKVGDCRHGTNFWKSCKKLTRRQESMQNIPLVYSVIFMHKLDIIRKE